MNNEQLYSKNTYRILTFLCAHPHTSFYNNQIAKNVQLSNGGTSQTLRLLTKAGLLLANVKGRMTFYQINTSSPIIKQFNILNTTLLLNNLITKLQPISERIVLFGSCAEGTNTKESDIDLLVISHQQKDIQTIFNQLNNPNNIQLILKSPQEYITLEKDHPTFFIEIERGIILWQKV